jgi:hypothetical protein
MTTAETATIILPLPPRVLSPNCPAGTRGGRFARAAAAKKYKRLASEATRELRIESGPWAKAIAGDSAIAGMAAKRKVRTRGRRYQLPRAAGMAVECSWDRRCPPPADTASETLRVPAGKSAACVVGPQFNIAALE